MVFGPSWTEDATQHVIPWAGDPMPRRFQKKLLDKGFAMEYCHSEKSNGVGGNATKASKMFRKPFAIELGPEFKPLAGVIEPFELETLPITLFLCSSHCPTGNVRLDQGHEGRHCQIDGLWSRNRTVQSQAKRVVPQKDRSIGNGDAFQRWQAAATLETVACWY